MRMKEQFWLSLEAWALAQDTEDVEEHLTNTAYIEAAYFGKESIFSTGSIQKEEEAKDY